MVYAERLQDRRPLATAAVASTLLFISCVDGFLKNTHGNTIFYVLKDFALIALVVAMVISLGVRPWERPKGKWQGLWAWWLYIGYMLAQVLNPRSGDIMTGIAGFRALVLFAVLYFVGAVFFTNPKRVSNTINVAIACIMIPALAAIVQGIAPDTWNSLSPSLSVLSHKFTSYQGAGLGGLTTAFMRAYGTLVDPASLGLATCVGFVLAAGALARSRGFARFWFSMCLITMALALQFSGSRASAAALAAGLLVFLILSWKHRSMRVPAAVAFCILLLAIPLALKATGGLSTARYQSDSLDYGAMTRARSQRIVLVSTIRQPFGNGLGATGAGGRLNRSGGAAPLLVDNLYYATLYQSGLPGLVIFLIFQGTFLMFAVRGAAKAKTTQTRAAYITLASIQSALLVSGIWTQGSFVYAPVSQIFWLLSGIIALPNRVEGESS
jgi:hypothetical protein